MDSCLRPNVAVGFQAKWYGVSGDDYGLVGLKLVCAHPLALVFDTYHPTSTCMDVRYFSSMHLCPSGFLTGGQSLKILHIIQLGKTLQFFPF